MEPEVSQRQPRGKKPVKLKCRPEDFRVEELPVVEPGGQGRYAFYRLTKRGLGTPEAIEAIRRRWGLAAAQVHYGGLKDRHAETVQYLTILNGPNRALRQANLTLEPLGALGHPYGPAHFRGNRFEVVIRDLAPGALAALTREAALLPRDGLPNYFDDQRFGSVGASGAFIAEAWLRGNDERALWMALAEPTASDRPGTKREKAILREHWGRWDEAKARLDRSHARSLATYLVDHPSDFRGAFARLRRDLRSLYFSAFQSHLWNLILARRIEQVTRPDQRVPIAFKLASLPLHRGLEPAQAAELTATPIPLPAARTALTDGPVAELARAVVAARGLAWDDLRIKHLRDVFFSKGSRPALFFPARFRFAGSADELHPGRAKVVVAFELPRGAYATLVVKRLTEIP